jgi:hypothetical protein
MEDVMNKLKVTTIAIALLSTAVFAQQDSRSGAVRVQNADSTITAKKAVMLSGRVSEDGKLLMTEDQDRWTVNNPSLLLPHAGQLVNVKCQLSADQNSIHVLLVKPAGAQYVAAHSDSAFRR